MSRTAPHAHGLCALPNRWIVSIARQGSHIQRVFHNGTWGGAAMTGQIATAYRDALVHLIPPFTIRQRQTRLISTNTSGKPGVVRKFTPDRWVAECIVDGVLRRKYNSVRKWGEAGAKARAIAQREEWERALATRFDVREPQVEQHIEHTWGHLLEIPDTPSLSQEEIGRRVGALNIWFDSLQPVELRFTASWTQKTKYGFLLVPRLRIRSASGLQQWRRPQILTGHTVQQVLQQRWQAMLQDLPQLVGEEATRRFDQRYRQEFMALQAGQLYSARMVVDTQQERWYHPPPELAPYLREWKPPQFKMHHTATDLDAPDADG